MKIVSIALNIDNYEDRKNIVVALANAGYNVRVEEKRRYGILLSQYFVIFDANDAFRVLDGQTISWQDFLELQPYLVEDKMETIKNMRGKYKNNLNPTTTGQNKQALLEAFTAGWDAAHNNRFSIGVNFDKWYHEKEGEV